MPIEPIIPKTWISVEQLAERLGVHQRTVRNRIREGVIRAHRIGRLIRVSEAEYERYITASEK